MPVVTEIQEVWKKLKTRPGYTDYCKSLGMVSPMTVTIDYDCYQFVSVTENISTLLSNKAVFEQIYENSFCSDLDLVDFCSGKLFLTHSFFNNERENLRIHLYCDEIEVCNPLGTSKSISKLTCIYYTIGNLGTKFYSSLKCIFLALVVKSSIIRKHGYGKVLAPLIHDLKNLELQGVTIEITYGSSVKECHTFYGSVATLSADNLAAHEIGGFRRCFSSGSVCRFCHCTYSEIKSKHTDEDFILRNPVSHSVQVQAVASNSSLIPLYGVRGSCPLSSLNGFSAVNSIPPDIMDDCLEGVIPGVLKMIFSFTIAHVPNLSLKELNRKICLFSFGKSDKKNKPRCLPNNVVKSDASVVLNASEAWCLFRVLPFIIGNVFDSENLTWKLYCLLAEILQIVFAPKIQRSWLSGLKEMIEKFYSGMLSLSPELVKPKFHYLLHYPSAIEKYGPLRHVWCMRFEAFHVRIKAIAKRSRNFRNLSYTVENDLQKFKCWEQTANGSVDSILSSNFHGAIKRVPLQELPSIVQTYFVEKFPETDLSFVDVTNNACINNVCYAVDNVLITEMCGDVPIFGKITKLIFYNNILIILLLKLETCMYDQHLCSYRVEVTSTPYLLVAGQEVSHHQLDLYEVASLCYIRLRFKVF